MKVDLASVIKSKSLALVCAGALTVPILIGCSSESPTSGANLPPVDDSRGTTLPSNTNPAPPKTGMSTKTKLVILAGAAALYYMYKKNQAKRAAGTAAASEPQYYLSKNGRVYYRDNAGRAHWVTPPPNGISVPAEEADQYRQFRGYNNQQTGRDLVGLGRD